MGDLIERVRGVGGMITLRPVAMISILLRGVEEPKAISAFAGGHLTKGKK